MRCQQLNKTRTGLRQVIYTGALGGRANLQVLDQAVQLVAEQLRDPDQAPKCLEGHQVDIVGVSTPLIMRHQQMQIITNAKYLEATDQAGLLGFIQAGAGDRLEQCRWRGMPHLATSIGFDVRQRLTTGTRVACCTSGSTSPSSAEGMLSNQAQALCAGPRPPLRLFSGHIRLKLSVLHHALDGLTCLVLE